ncbi:hypothetical protein BpHYR1_049812 [Brachionus plicatilis]|uniref:Uncharacterized protein n=1 Tax=Brachionus plicatilis TaxID=10195 RepID=A0A3M7RL18_BRAPC|nr:hypothetical protein BpHYR1_049812 [Brachionus plicatilis]
MDILLHIFIMKNNTKEFDKLRQIKSILNIWVSSYRIIALSLRTSLTNDQRKAKITTTFIDLEISFRDALCLMNNNLP